MKNKIKITLTRGCIIAMLVYVVCVIGVYYIAGDQFQYHQDPDSISSVESNMPASLIVKDFSVVQTFTSQTNTLDAISVKLATYSRINHGSLKVRILDKDSNSVLFEKDIDVSGLKDNSFSTFEIKDPIQNVKGKHLAILLSSDSTDSANAVTAYYNNIAKVNAQQLYFNNKPVEGVLCFTASGTEPILFGRYYFLIMSAVGLILALYCFNLYLKEKNEKKSLGLSLIHAFKKYQFLLSQLVNRDFKTKYKRSVLGVLWSFLNPLLSMTVQYIVFSTIFKSDIPNFAVYLLIGIVFFSFFTEATSMGLSSIVGNSSLITKVYIPKYIFPISRVLSSAINLMFSLIPLFFVILFTGTPFTPSLLLLPFAIICTIVFCMGMGMLLSSMMVFFRDTLFLWNVISMLWMYATPIFYPESILPNKLMFIFKLNPLYHFIRFSRILVLQGVSPEPQAYLFCLIAAFVPFALGAIVFKKSQDKFVLYI